MSGLLGVLVVVLAAFVVARASPAGRWVVAVQHPTGDWRACFEDPAVASGLQAASMPPTAASATLHAGAPRDAADRIAACLRDQGNLDVEVLLDP